MVPNRLDYILNWNRAFPVIESGQSDHSQE